MGFTRRNDSKYALSLNLPVILVKKLRATREKSTRADQKKAACPASLAVCKESK
jgi:hypothetical protein